ncbi:MAG: VWA domain-containing protein [Pyrinomonadaceae bacterium]|nr:VWA domain-containing protein [Pyrinomonadaceae bacterium]MBP6212131.1 VWA domain-containing protein [Pyrinomonadaceae bacterium]
MKYLRTGIQLTVALWVVGSLFSVTAQVVDDAPIKINTVLLNVPVVVSDKDGRNITGLKKEDFSVYQEGVKQTIEFFANTEEPLNVAIVVDTSSSVRRVIKSLKKAASDFISTLGPDDKGLLMSFDIDVHLLCELTSDKDDLRKSLNSLFILEGADSLGIDAIYRIHKKEFASIKGRKAIVLITDGGIGGYTPYETWSRMLKESDTAIYPIWFQTRPVVMPNGAKTATLDELLKVPVLEVAFMNRLATDTGGRLFAGEADNFNGAFQRIVDELKKTYVLGFYPTNTDEGKPTNITIKVNRNDAVVRSKKVIQLKPRKKGGK